MSMLSKVVGARFCGPIEKSSLSSLSSCHLARYYQSLVAFMPYSLSRKIVVAKYSKVLVMRKQINKKTQSNKQKLSPKATACIFRQCIVRKRKR